MHIFDLLMHSFVEFLTGILNVGGLQWVFHLIHRISTLPYLGEIVKLFAWVVYVHGTYSMFLASNLP